MVSKNQIKQKMNQENNETISKHISAGKTMPVGLTSEEVKERAAKSGKNILITYTRSSDIDLFISQFSYPILLLIIAAIFMATVNLLYGISIFLIILITIVTNWKRSRDTENEIIKNINEFSGETRAFRDGVLRRIKIEEIVPGDIVFLEKGMMVPADGVVIRAENCKVDETIFQKGIVEKMPEQEIQKTFKPQKSDPSSVMAGTFVINGECMIMVTNTGQSTKYYKTIGHKEPFSTDPKRNDAIGRVKRATDSFTPVVYIISLIILLQLILDEVPIFTAIVIAAAAVVAAIPETTYSIASNIYTNAMTRMSKYAIIRKEGMVDKLGRTTIIGTEILKSLSRNEPTVRNIWIDRKEITITGDGWDILGIFKEVKSYASIDLLTELAAASTEAELEYINNKQIMDGDPIEGALIVMAMKNRIPINNIRGEWVTISKKKDEVTITELKKKNRTTFVMFGPAEKVMKRCKSLYSNGKFLKIDEKLKEEIEHQQVRMNARGQEVYAIAFAWKKKEPQYFTLLSIIGIYDPPKPEVKKKIEELINAGIKPIIITSEKSGRAVNIAKETGIMKKGSKAMICDEIKFLRPEERTEKILSSTVFSEATTEYEKIILDTFRQEGHKITYIESIGIDATTFLYSDVGLAIESAPDTIKYNADGIVRNDNYEAVMDLVWESRNMRMAIERTFYALFASDLSIFFTVLISAIIFTGNMVTAMQILLINLIADTAIAVSFSNERIYEEPVARKKTSKKFPETNEYVFVLLVALITSIYIGVITTLETFKNYEQSITVGSLLFAIIAIQINSISINDSILESMKRISRHLILSIAIIIGIMLAAFYLPFISSLFEMKPMSLTQWAYAIPLILGLTILFEIKKFFNRQKR